MPHSQKVFLKYFILLTVTVDLFACASTDRVQHTNEAGTSRVTYGIYEGTYSQYLKSEPGTYYFSLIGPLRVGGAPDQALTLFQLRSDGTVLHSKTYEHMFRKMILGDIKVIKKGVLGYLLAANSPYWRANFRFLDQDFNDIFYKPVPNYDVNLDSQEFQKGPNGNLFFLFNRDRLRDAIVDQEIVEWDKDGNPVFSWSTRSLAEPDDQKPEFDRFHLNAFSWTPDGNLLIGLSETSEILKIGYPSGNVLWRMSFRDWKFKNDPANGFRKQHSVTMLANGNLLIFDNGGMLNKNFTSRAVEYSIDVPKKEATLVWEYRSEQSFANRADGGYAQRLKNGNTLITWGIFQDPESDLHNRSLPVFTEVNPAGQKVREFRTDHFRGAWRVYFDEDMEK
jgi:hypothetical protein